MDYLNEIGKQGILGLLAAASLSLNFWLLKMVLSEKDKRIQAAEKVRDELVAPIAHIKESLELINEKVAISKEKR